MCQIRCEFFILQQNNERVQPSVSVSHFSEMGDTHVCGSTPRSEPSELQNLHRNLAMLCYD